MEKAQASRIRPGQDLYDRDGRRVTKAAMLNILRETMGIIDRSLDVENRKKFEGILNEIVSWSIR